MADPTLIVIEAVKFGYREAGPKGAVAAAVAVGASYAIVVRILSRYTDLDEKQIDEIYEKISNDDEIVDILGEEFFEQFKDYFDTNGMSGASTTN